MAARQFSVPMLIKNGAATRLERVRADDMGKSEDWLQELLFNHPVLIPFEEIEPEFGGLVLAVRELRTACGPVDLFCVNAKGHITLVETKLWRNPEARREVVGQIIDYATEISRWTYGELASAARISSHSMHSDPLIAAAREAAAEDFNEADFTYTVSRDLTQGRFLLLIVGDGIHEGVEHMAEFLQRAPRLGFTLALVELALFKTSDQSESALFVQPRVLARTREITRAVVEIRSMVSVADITVTVPDVHPGRSSPTKRPSPLSEELFLEELSGAAGQEIANLAKLTISEASAHGLEVDERGGAGPILKYNDDSGEFFNFGQIRADGKLGSSERFSEKCVRLGMAPEIWHDYYAAILQLIPGSRRLPRKDKGVPGPFERIGSAAGDLPPLAPLLRNRDKWFGAIDIAVDRLRSQLARRLP